MNANSPDHHRRCSALRLLCSGASFLHDGLSSRRTPTKFEIMALAMRVILATRAARRLARSSARLGGNLRDRGCICGSLHHAMHDGRRATMIGAASTQATGSSFAGNANLTDGDLFLDHQMGALYRMRHFQ